MELAARSFTPGRNVGGKSGRAELWFLSEPSLGLASDAGSSAPCSFLHCSGSPSPAHAPCPVSASTPRLHGPLLVPLLRCL